MIMRVIGITGGIGAGKTDILQFLRAEYKAHVIQADKIARVLQQPEMVCYEKIVKHFGKDILHSDKTIHRAKLAEIVFADKDQLQMLNQMVHPEVKEYIKTTLEFVRNQNVVKYFVIEAALLIEDHYDEICDQLWYVYAEPNVRKERLLASRIYTEEKIDQIMKAQLSEEIFLKHCDVVLNNNGDMEQTYKQIREELKCQSK